MLRVFGEGFGPNVSYAAGDFDVMVGQTKCVTTKWVSQSAIDCVLAAGTGMNLDVTIAISDYTSRLEGIFAYDRPKITELYPSHTPTSANTTMSIHGENFGASCAIDPGNSPSCYIAVSVGMTRCEDVRWFSVSALTCRIAPALDSRWQ